MRLIFTTIIFLLFAITNHAQKLTGIWRGYFVQQSFDIMSGQFREDRYKYELQINNLANNAIEGVTYSYKNTVFYGKAKIQGIYNKKTKTIVFKETKMIELKINDNSSPCLMTCFIDYTKDGKKEILSGKYTSVNTDKVSECGNGTVYLERVTNTEFKKEPFLLRKDLTEKKPTTKENNNTTAKTNSPKPQIITKLKYRPGAEEFLQLPKTTDSIVAQPKPDTAAIAIVPPIEAIDTDKLLTTIPEMLVKRKNELLNTVVVDAKEVKIEYYDNGQIDNDTITVYDNNKLVISKNRLSYAPITLNIHLDEDHPLHEIITVANNLGDIPPNTALMVITAGDKKYEVFIISDEQRNAKINIEYKPGGDLGVHRNK